MKFGISFTATFYNQAGALVLVYRDGSVQVNHGGTEMGQGLLHQDPAGRGRLPGRARSLSVRVMPTRTDKVPNTSATAASAGTDLNGAAVADACAQIRSRLAAIAAAAFDCEPLDVRFETGMVSAAAESRCRSRRSARRRTSSACRSSRRASTGRPRFTSISRPARGRPFHYFAYGAAVSEVEVDGFTGEYRLLRTDILQDVGESISPMVDRGQIEGGFIQGVGWLTLEELLWDAQGRRRDRRARPPTSCRRGRRCPTCSTWNFSSAPRSRASIMGSKAIGEPPLMLAISVREALRDAVAAFGRSAGDVVPFDSPATPERVFFAVRRVRAAASPRPVRTCSPRHDRLLNHDGAPSRHDFPHARTAALACHEDGGLLIRDGRIVACGDFDGRSCRASSTAQRT